MEFKLSHSWRKTIPMPLVVDIISDVVCPWCYVGKRRLEKAISQLNTRLEVRVNWHPFELNPQIPQQGMDRRTYRISKFGSWEKSVERDAQMTEVGRGEGILFALDRIERTPNTFHAHQLIRLAEKEGIQDAVVEGLFRAYFTEGRDISSHHELLAVVMEAGLDGNRAEQVIQTNELAEQIRDEERQAHSAGVHGVPYFVINNREAISGAREASVFLDALHRAQMSTQE